MPNQEMETRVYTIDDIARELGVSKTTVSRAISGKGRLSAQTREKVLDFIEKHHYRPNAVAKGLAQSRTYNLGLVMPGDCSVTDMTFFQECMSGICEVAAAHDYDVLLTMVSARPAAQVERVILNRKVDGVIVSRSTVGSPVVELLRRERFPFVLVGYSPEEDVLFVDNENREACKDLTSLLIGKGRRRLALLGGNERHFVTLSRRRGFEEAHRQAGLALCEERIFLGMDSAGKVKMAVGEALRQGADCIVCMDDYICNLALTQLREWKVRIPQEMWVASFYDSKILEHNTPPVTSLHFDARELGKAVCLLLLDRLEGKEAGQASLPGYQIILRDSTK